MPGQIIQVICPACGGTGTGSSGTDIICARCAQHLGPYSFSAEGKEAMQAQTEIVTAHIRWDAIRQITSYGVSAVFGIVAGLIVAFAPPANQFVAETVAIAFLVVAAGVAGYTYVRAKTKHIDVTAGQSATDKPKPIGKRRA